MTKHHGKQEGHTGEHQENSAWAHWDYTPDEWAKLDQIDWGRTLQRYILFTVLATLGFLAILALFAWGLVNAGDIFGWGVVPLTLLLILFLYIVVPGKGFHKARKRHKARQNPSQPHRVTLSGKGMWMAGTFFPFEGTGVEASDLSVKLCDVRLTAQPMTVHFRVEYRVFGGITSHGAQRASQRQWETIHLLVPAGHESEAELVAQRYHAEVIEARELAKLRLQDSIVNPPEPS